MNPSLKIAGLDLSDEVAFVRRAHQDTDALCLFKHSVFDFSFDENITEFRLLHAMDDDGLGTARRDSLPVDHADRVKRASRNERGRSDD